MTAPQVGLPAILPTAPQTALWPVIPAPSGGQLSTWTFPDTDLGVKVELAWGADPGADPATWTFVDVSSRLLRDQPIVIRRGRSDGSASLSSSSCTFALDNSDGELTPTRRASSLWPYVRRTTPVRISVTNVGPNPPYTRFCGFVAAITPRIVPGVGGYNLSTVTIQAAGVTRRLSQGAVAKSALKRSILGQDPVAYWALEDGSDVSQFSSSLSGGKALDPAAGAGYASVLGADDDLAPGTRQVAQWTSSVAHATISSPGGATTVLPTGSGTAWSMTVSFRATNPNNARVCWALMVATLPTISPGIYTFIEAYSDSGGTGIKFEFGATDLQSTAVNVFDGEPHEVTVIVTPLAATTLQLYIDGALAASTSSAVSLAFPDQMWVAAQPFAVTPALDTPNNVNSTVSVGHLAYFNSVVTGPFYDALIAYTGERAEIRAARVIAEEGAPSAVTGRGIRMGPQPIATAMDIMRETETTDRGILYEPRDSFALGFIAHKARYNRTPAITIDLSTYRTGDEAAGNVLAPVYDDQRLRNQWTITRTADGTTATVSDADSIAADGLYDDSDNANVEDDAQPAQVAAWRVAEGVVPDGMRYPSPSIDPGANPDTLLPQWLVADIGDVIVRTNAPTEHTGEDIVEILMGYAETLRPRSWTATTSVAPAELWQRLHQMGSFDGNLGRVDSKTSTVATAPGTSATSLSVAVTGVLWRTGAVSFDLEVGPERMTVTNISGGSSPQTFTVVRSVNGIVNDPAAGTTVRLWRPGRYGL